MKHYYRIKAYKQTVGYIAGNSESHVKKRMGLKHLPRHVKLVKVI